MGHVGIGGFGSVNNHLSAIGTKGAPEPEVGMGCTMLGWTDRYPYTVIAVVMKGKVIDHIVVQEDDAKRVDDNGMSECQSYEYTPNGDGAVRYLKRNKRNQWVEAKPRLNPEGRVVGLGRAKVKDATVFRMGDRSRYNDYSF